MSTRPKRKVASKVEYVGPEVFDPESQDEDFAMTSNQDFVSEGDVASDETKEKIPKQSPKRPKKRLKKEPEVPAAEDTTAFESLPAGVFKNQGKLSLLPTMPVDVLTEIFSLLLPQDIINLSRTSQALRNFLMSRQAGTVWKTARERIGAPDCPVLISEPRWASLMHGSACSNCGTRNVHYLAFTLLRRACLSCRNSHLISAAKVKKEYRGIDLSVLDLLPYQEKRARKSFWDTELQHVLKQLEAMKRDAGQGLPGAQQTLDEFRRSRKEAVVGLCQLEFAFNSFLRKHGRDTYMDEAKIGQKRLHDIQARFKDVGYEDEDLKCLQTSEICTRNTELTDRAWKSLRDEVEQLLKRHRSIRLEKAHGSVRCERRKLIAVGYEKYRRGVPTSQWKYLPRALDISFLEPFAKLVTADDDRKVTHKDFERPFKKLHRLLEEYDDTLKDHLVSLLPAPGQKKGKGKARSTASVAQLDLAHSVFECKRTRTGCPRLIGWDSIASHHCPGEEEGLHLGNLIHPTSSYEYDRALMYCARGATVANHVIKLVGLEPATATVDDMDEVDLRFACGRCATSWMPKDRGYSWRGIIDHVVQEQRYSKKPPSPSVFVLSAAEAQSIKDQERSHSIWQKPHWICGHCPEYTLANRQEKNVLETHLREKHEVEDPQEGIDIIFFERTAPVFVEPFPEVVAVRPKKDTTTTKTAAGSEEKHVDQDDNFLCLRCADSSAWTVRRKTYSLDAVKKHLLVKHQVPGAKSDVDYKLKSATA